MKRSETTKIKLINGIQFYPKSSCVFPSNGTVVDQATWAVNSCSNSNELGAQYVWPHQKPKNTTPAGKGHACCLLDMLHCKQLVQRQKRRFVVVRQSFTGTVWKFRGNQDNRSSRTSKKVHNRRANCFTLLRRITTLKCANSEVKSVHIHLKKGSLKWVHGTMSEPPWKSH